MTLLNLHRCLRSCPLFTRPCMTRIFHLTRLGRQRDHVRNSQFPIFVVTPCMLLSYSIIKPTTAYIYIYIYKIYTLKYLKTLPHVSVLGPSKGSHIILAKVTLDSVTLAMDDMAPC